MDARLEFDTLESFVAALAARNIRGVALRWVKEKRPRQLPDHKVEVGFQQWVELTAYQKGTVLYAKLVGAEPGPTQAALKDAGLTVRAQPGNIT